MALDPSLPAIKHITFLLASGVCVCVCVCVSVCVCVCVMIAFFACLVYMCTSPQHTFMKKLFCFLGAGIKSQSLRCFSLIYSVFPLTKPITALSSSSYCVTFIRERKRERIRETLCVPGGETSSILSHIPIYSIFQNAIREANYLSSLYYGCGSDGL